MKKIVSFPPSFLSGFSADFSESTKRRGREERGIFSFSLSSPQCSRQIERARGERRALSFSPFRLFSELKESEAPHLSKRIHHNETRPWLHQLSGFSPLSSQFCMEVLDYFNKRGKIAEFTLQLSIKSVLNRPRLFPRLEPGKPRVGQSHKKPFPTHGDKVFPSWSISISGSDTIDGLLFKKPGFCSCMLRCCPPISVAVVPGWIQEEEESSRYEDIWS